MKVIAVIIATTILNIGFAQNPLAQQEDLFSGNYIGEAFNLTLEKTIEGYNGNIDFDGQVFPVVTQASGVSLTGYFISSNDHFDIAATLNGNNLSFLTGGKTYTLTKVLVAQNQNTQTPTQTTAPQGSVLIAENQQYPAGTVLQSPWTGVSFVVPENHTAYFDADFGGFLMLTQDGNSLIAIEASSQASAEELGIFAIEALAEYLLKEEANYQVVGQPSFEADLLKAQVLIGEAMISVAAKQATTRNAAAVLAYGPQAEQLAQTVVNGITLTQPNNDVANWEQKMYGMHASISSSSSDYSDGVVSGTTGSYAGQAKFNYDFCSDGNYRHEYNDIAYFSTGTTSGEMIGSVKTGSEGAHQGAWYLVSSLMGNLLLILESTEGTTYVHPIAESETGAYINSRNYAVSQSQLCR